jgi:predicted RNA-binding Zn ribbon-like protein
MAQAAQWQLGSERQLSRETLAELEGRLCLGLVNTAHPRFGRHPDDALAGYDDLVAWYRSLPMLTEGQEQELLRRARAHSERARNAFERIVVWREATYRVLSAVAAEDALPSEDLDVMQTAYAEAMACASLSPATRAFSWEMGPKQAGEGMLSLLWPAATSALELFTTSQDMRKLKACPGCGFLFLDRSKTGNRRWCSMDECGSRDKMRRHYARNRTDR